MTASGTFRASVLDPSTKFTVVTVNFGVRRFVVAFNSFIVFSSAVSDECPPDGTGFSEWPAV